MEAYQANKAEQRELPAEMSCLSREISGKRERNTMKVNLKLIMFTGLVSGRGTAVGRVLCLGFGQ